MNCICNNLCNDYPQLLVFLVSLSRCLNLKPVKVNIASLLELRLNMIKRLVQATL